MDFTCFFVFTIPPECIPSFTGFYLVVSSFTWFYLVLPSFTGFYLVFFMDFTCFLCSLFLLNVYLVLLGFS